MEFPLKSEPNRRSDGTFGPGNLANPAGRPKGKTIKERVREYLEEHPDSMEAFVQHFVANNRDLAWQMLEGRPQSDIKQELTGKDGGPISHSVTVNFVDPKKDGSTDTPSIQGIIPTSPL